LTINCRRTIGSPAETAGRAQPVSRSKRSCEFNRGCARGCVEPFDVFIELAAFGHRAVGIAATCRSYCCCCSAMAALFRFEASRSAMLMPSAMFTSRRKRTVVAREPGGQGPSE
jgi:hypothetical protein